MYALLSLPSEGMNCVAAERSCIFRAQLRLRTFFEGDIVRIGLRTLSLKKSLKARTTGRLKRKIIKATNPFYGKNGMGYIKNPKRAIKNKIYHKTTFSWNNKDTWIHILLFFTTAGIGNIIYLISKKK